VPTHLGKPGRLLAVILVTLLLAILAACGGTPPSPTANATPTASARGSDVPNGPSTPAPSDDLGAVYAAIEEQVVDIRGLEPRRPVEPLIVSPDEMAEILAELVFEDAPEELLLAYERLYQAMGLMEAEASLADVYVDLLESQVGGLYVPDGERLYVVSQEGELGAIERVLYAHEFAHALQDQHFDLESVQVDLVDQTDRQLARQALVEGDAYVLNTQWMISHLVPTLSPDELQELIESSTDPEALAALERIPPIVQSSILFAATHGTQWVLGLQGRGGWAAVDAAWERPPESTEQILHIEKYEAGEDPLDVALPSDLAGRLGPGWEVVLEDTFGEHQLGIWLSGNDAPSGIVATLPDVAADAAEGWGGDRVALLGGADGETAVVLQTEWDTATDAGEFAERATAVLEELGVIGLVARQTGSASVRVFIGSDDATLLLLDRTLGHTGA